MIMDKKNDIENILKGLPLTEQHKEILTKEIRFLEQQRKAKALD